MKTPGIDQLSARTARALCNHGYTNYKEIFAAVVEGKLYPKSHRGYGPAAHGEVCEWLVVAIVLRYYEPEPPRKHRVY